MKLVSGSAGARRRSFNRVRRLDSRRDEEEQLAGALKRLGVLEELSDERNASQPRHLTDVQRIGVDKYSTDDRRSAVRNQNLSRGLLRRH